MKKIIFIAGILITNTLLSQQASYIMTSENPIAMTSMGIGVYNQTIFYHNLGRGLTIDLAKMVDNINATPIDFNINARGGLHPFFAIKGNNGNIGIGTTTPTQKLDIRGNILTGSADSILGTNAFAIRYVNGSLSNWGALRSSGSSYMSFGVKANGSDIGWLSSSGEASLRKTAITVGDEGFSFLATSSQQIAIDSPVSMNEVMKISPNGNALLQGKLEAKEIKVTLTPTADFVFEENYALPKLEEVARHIKEKKHLPEIASAKVMEKEGVNVGEFQIKLLQKIEELTLYIIEQNKQLKDQKEEIQQLKEQFHQKSSIH